LGRTQGIVTWLG